MQATVHRPPEPGADGSVLLDDGLEVPFGHDQVAESGLRHVRRGQRLTVEIDEGRVTRLRITGIGAGEAIR